MERSSRRDHRDPGLTTVYAGTDVAAPDSNALAVKRREISGPLGPNGAGKTTTAGIFACGLTYSREREFSQ